MKYRQILPTMLSALGLAIATVTVAIAAVPSPTPGQLQQYDIGATYVSGVSSGGYLANQLHVAYSSVFQGAGIFTAGPYECAQGDSTANTAQFACMKTYQARKTPAQLEQLTRDRATAGTVDPVAGLSGDKVYLYHGTNDQTVVQAVNDDLATYYRDFGSDVVYDRTSTAGHAWVSPLGPVACASTASPFINDCGNDPERAMLGHLFGSVNAATTTSLTGKLIQFDQRAYAPGGSAAAISMGDEGFAYVPAACTAGQSCKLMVTLHGCKQGYRYQSMGDTFMKDAYLNEYADTNNMIVLYPQAIPASTGTIVNPNGCWNWWGYGGDAAYAQHSGAQITAIMNMVGALRGTTPTPTPTTPIPTPTTSTGCTTASNYAHVQAGRAYQSGGIAYATGSGQSLGLWNLYVFSTLKTTAPGYWVKC